MFVPLIITCKNRAKNVSNRHFCGFLQVGSLVDTAAVTLFSAFFFDIFRYSEESFGKPRTSHGYYG